MIANWPGKVSSGAESDHLAAFWDVLPTMAELTGEPVPSDIDGVSFLPTLLEKRDKGQVRPYLVKRLMLSEEFCV